MSGASVAAELAAHGAVVLVEQESHPGYHSTGRSAAAFIPSYGVESVPLRTLTEASLAFFQTQAFGGVSVPLLAPRGLITIGKSRDAATSRSERTCVAGLISGDILELSESEAMAHLPNLRPAWAQYAWFEPDVFDIDVDATHQYFLRQIQALGGDIHCSKAVTSIKRGHGVWHVQVGSDVISAPIVVNAAGAWSSLIAQMAGSASLSLTPMRRTALCFSPPANIDTRYLPLVLDQGGSFYMKPDAGQLLVSPADEHESVACDAQPEELDIAYAIHNMQRAFDVSVDRVNHSWAGLRTFAPDRQPVIGFDQTLDGFFWLAGHGGHGIQIAPAAARAACGLIIQRELPADLQALGLQAADISPNRFANPITQGSLAHG